MIMTIIIIIILSSYFCKVLEVSRVTKSFEVSCKILRFPYNYLKLVSNRRLCRNSTKF